MFHKSLVVFWSVALVAACGTAERASLENEAPSRGPGATGRLRSSLIVGGGRPLYVTHAISSEIAVFTINRDGSLARGSSVATQPTPRGIVFHPDGRTAYVANAQHVSVYSVGALGALDERQPPIAVGNAGILFGSAVAPNGRMLYASATVDDQLFAFHLASNGKVASLADPVGIVRPKGVAVTPNGRFVYVSQGLPSDEEPDTVSGFAVQADGTLRLFGSVPIGASGAAVAVTPDGRFLYVACQVSDAVFGFRIGSDGGLAPLEPSSVPAPIFPEGATVSADGRYLYVTTPQSPHVRVFSIGSDGALAELLDSPFPTGTGPIGIAPTPDASFLFVSNIGGPDLQHPFPGSVTSFAVRADGGLTLLEQEVPTEGFNPAFQSAAVLTNQGPVAQFSARLRGAGQPTLFDATASTDSDGIVARYDWDFGDGTQLPDAGPTPTHVYPQSGTFTVTLTVMDDEGCSTRMIYTGQIAYCNGSPAAGRQRTLRIPPR